MRYGLLALAAFAAAGCGRQASESTAPTAGCGEGASGIVVSDAWVRAADENRPATAAYLTLCNAGETADALVAAGAAVARAVELHETVRAADGVTRMNAVERFELAPAKPVVFAPGGAHIMLIGLNEPLAAGSTATLTLEFENGGAITIEAPVRDAAPASDHHH